MKMMRGLTTRIYVCIYLVILELALAANAHSSNDLVENMDVSNFKAKLRSAGPNQVSMVEFYAPWCGHCKALRPEYTKAAKSLKDIALLGAVNCDDDKNKGLCQKYGIRGFPTLKVFTSELDNNNKLKFREEPYNGERTSKSISSYLLSKIGNRVTWLKNESSLRKFLEARSSTRVILLSSKNSKSVPPLFKVIANEFQRTKFGYASSTEEHVRASLGLPDDGTSQLILIPEDSDDIIAFEGTFGRSQIRAFIRETVLERRKLASSSSQSATTDQPASSSSIVASEKKDL